MAAPRVVAVLFRRKFGQTPVLTAGCDLARGEWVITIDADLPTCCHHNNCA
jgi:hypothetical protein